MYGRHETRKEESNDYKSIDTLRSNQEKYAKLKLSKEELEARTAAHFDNLDKLHYHLAISKGEAFRMFLDGNKVPEIDGFSRIVDGKLFIKGTDGYFDATNTIIEMRVTDFREDEYAQTYVASRPHDFNTENNGFFSVRPYDKKRFYEKVYTDIRTRTSTYIPTLTARDMTRLGDDKKQIIEELTDSDAYILSLPGRFLDNVGSVGLNVLTDKDQKYNLNCDGTNHILNYGDGFRVDEYGQLTVISLEEFIGTYEEAKNPHRYMPDTIIRESEKRAELNKLKFKKMYREMPEEYRDLAKRTLKDFSTIRNKPFEESVKFLHDVNSEYKEEKEPVKIDKLHEVTETIDSYFDHYRYSYKINENEVEYKKGFLGMLSNIGETNKSVTVVFDKEHNIAGFRCERSNEVTEQKETKDIGNFKENMDEINKYVASNLETFVWGAEITSYASVIYANQSIFANVDKVALEAENDEEVGIDYDEDIKKIEEELKNEELHKADKILEVDNSIEHVDIPEITEEQERMLRNVQKNTRMQTVLYDAKRNHPLVYSELRRDLKYISKSDCKHEMESLWEDKVKYEKHVPDNELKAYINGGKPSYKRVNYIPNDFYVTPKSNQNRLLKYERYILDENNDYRFKKDLIITPEKFCNKVKRIDDLDAKDLETDDVDFIQSFDNTSSNSISLYGITINREHDLESLSEEQQKVIAEHFDEYADKMLSSVCPDYKTRYGVEDENENEGNEEDDLEK